MGVPVITIANWEGDAEEVNSVIGKSIMLGAGAPWANLLSRVEWQNFVTDSVFYPTALEVRFVIRIRTMNRNPNALPPVIMGAPGFIMPSPVVFSRPFRDSDNSIVLTSNGSLHDQGISTQSEPSIEAYPGTFSLPIESFPNSFSGTFSDTLPITSLDRKSLDVGVGFLVLETAVGPNEEYGAGLMLTFSIPRQADHNQ
jgi:hypothetical protein